MDGSNSSFFALSAGDKIASGDDWLMVDLNQPDLIDRYVVRSTPHPRAGRLASFTLQKSDDGFSWTDVDAVAANAQDRNERPVPAFKARFVRLYIPRGKPFSIDEFEFYYTGGKPVQASFRAE